MLEIGFEVNGVPIPLVARPYGNQGWIMIAAQNFQSLGAKVNQANGPQPLIGLSFPNYYLELVADSRTAWVNGQAVTLPVPPRIRRGLAMVPLRFVVESLGGSLVWDSANLVIRVSIPALGVNTGGMALATANVLFVTAGYEFPYATLDGFMVAALQAAGASVQVFDVQNRSPYELTTAAQQVKPRLILVMHGGRVPAEVVTRCRRLGYQTVLWLLDDPYQIDWSLQLARPYTAVLTIDKGCVEIYRQSGVARVEHLALGADPAVYHPQAVDETYRSDICLVGIAFQNRLTVVDQLLERFPGHNVKLVGQGWPALARAGQARIINSIVSASEAARYYNGAKIVLNIHRAADDDRINLNQHHYPATCPNNRAFEIAACGTLQICDWRPALSDYYRINQDVVAYQTTDELWFKIAYFLTHEGERQTIGQQALAQTLNNHTYLQRAQSLLAKFS